MKNKSGKMVYNPAEGSLWEEPKVRKGLFTKYGNGCADFIKYLVSDQVDDTEQTKNNTTE
jgi:hypothetical protein